MWFLPEVERGRVAQGLSQREDGRPVRARPGIWPPRTCRHHPRAASRERRGSRHPSRSPGELCRPLRTRTEGAVVGDLTAPSLRPIAWPRALSRARSLGACPRRSWERSNRTVSVLRDLRIRNCPAALPPRHSLALYEPGNRRSARRLCPRIRTGSRQRPPPSPARTGRGLPVGELACRAPLSSECLGSCLTNHSRQDRAQRAGGSLRWPRSSTGPDDRGDRR